MEHLFTAPQAAQFCHVRAVLHRQMKLRKWNFSPIPDLIGVALGVVVAWCFSSWIGLPFLVVLGLVLASFFLSLLVDGDPAHKRFRLTKAAPPDQSKQAEPSDKDPNAKL